MNDTERFTVKYFLATVYFASIAALAFFVHLPIFEQQGQSAFGQVCLVSAWVLFIVCSCVSLLAGTIAILLLVGHVRNWVGFFRYGRRLTKRHWARHGRN